MYEDFSFCTSCNYYDSGERRCNLFNRKIKVCGCQYGADRKPKNNYDKVKAMSMDELAVWLDDVSKSWYDEGYTKETDEPLMSPYPSTASKWLAWLKEEVHDRKTNTIKRPLA